jgi:hypothetical protein
MLLLAAPFTVHHSIPAQSRYPVYLDSSALGVPAPSTYAPTTRSEDSIVDQRRGGTDRYLTTCPGTTRTRTRTRTSGPRFLPFTSGITSSSLNCARSFASARHAVLDPRHSHGRHRDNHADAFKRPAHLELVDKRRLFPAPPPPPPPSGAMSSNADVDAWIAQLMQCKPLSEAEVKKLCDKVCLGLGRGAVRSARVVCGGGIRAGGRACGVQGAARGGHGFW